MKLFHFTYENHIPVAETVIEFFDNESDKVTIHNNVYKFNKSILKKMLIEFEFIKTILKDDFKIKRLIVCAKENDKKLSKYWKMFGFEKVMPLKHNGDGLIYSEMEI
jgi:hypothetical protein